MATERKLVVTEARRCRECGQEYLYDLLWERQYRVKMRRGPLNTDEFHSLCPEHKASLHGPELAYAYATRRIDDRDAEKMGLEPVEEEAGCGWGCGRCKG